MKGVVARGGPCQETLEEAAAWFVEFRDGGADALTQQNFNHWLRRSPDNIRAYLEIAGVWTDLPQTPTAASVDVTALIAAARTGATVVKLESLRSQVFVRSASQPGQSRWGRMAAAACIVLACAAAFFVWLARDVGYATGVGEQRFVTLPDGSTVVLNARSRMAVHFNDKERSIELVAGQAMFDVAADATRPFVVTSGETRVRAVGTQFDVYRKRIGTLVTVVEGRVAISPPPSNKGLRTAMTPSLVSAGEQVMVTPEAIRPASTVDVAAATAWTQRRLVFNSTALGEVAEEFNRYNPRPLIVEGDVLKHIQISGIYSSTDPASLVGFLRLQPGVQVVETPHEIKVELK